METKSEFIEFEIKQGTKILININKINHLSKDNDIERLWLFDKTYFPLKDGEYDRLKNELEARSKSLESINDSLSKLVENGLFIRLPGPRYSGL